MFIRRRGFPREDRLVHLQIHSVEQAAVRGDNVPRGQDDDVPGHDLPGRYFSLLPAADDGGGDRFVRDDGVEIPLGIPSRMREMAPVIIPLGRPATPEDAAGPIFFLCSPWSNFVHGQVITASGGQTTGMTS